MHIVVVGCGRVGSDLATQLSEDGHSVAIIDKNARIGSNVVISPVGKPDHVDHPNYYIRDGIVVIPKNGVVPDNMVI